MENHFLTEVNDYRKLLVQTEKLIGEKFAVKFSEDDVVFVSPAVYKLAETELDKLADSIIVRYVDGKSWRQLAESR